jgi:predicted secreted Zn-dependent protease
MRILHCISACRAQGGGVVRLLSVSTILALALQTPVVLAEISETLTYADYRVEANSRQSLLRQLTYTSPIRHDGMTFHAYTTWRVKWQYRWQIETTGNCRIAEVATTLDTSIQLPRLDGGNAQQQERFQRYLSALREHELGHHGIGRKAALEVDRQLKAMPAMADCSRLIAAANRLAQHIVERYKDEERTYDLVTEHGRTQGARLDH